MLFAITDIETTGGKAEPGSITEIAIVLHNGVKEIDRFETLINPGKRLPPFVSQLTGITDAMLARAPRFEEVANEIFDFLRDAVFVAHNVNFDFHYVKQEFAACGLKWTPLRMCTIRLARKAFPGLERYGLEHLCRELHLTNVQAHRAMGDTLATVQLFEMVWSEIGEQEVKNFLGRGSAETYLPHQLPESTIDDLPKTTGVYFMRDSKGSPIYIGKALNIRKRIKEHFQNGDPSKKVLFSNEVCAIDAIETSSELVALLVEDEAIRKFQPKFNVAQKRRKVKAGIFDLTDQRGFIKLVATNLSGQQVALRVFPTLPAAERWLIRFCEQFDFSLQAMGLPSDDELDPVNVHNNRIQIAIKKAFHPTHALITFRGRQWNEQMVLLVQNGLPVAYGYLNFKEESITDVEDLKGKLTPIASSELSASFIQQFMDSPKGHRVRPIA
jgi:DNA polymerase III subunit epsilon